MSEGNGKVFLGGMPYGPEVRRLFEAFPVQDLTENRIITHDQLEGASVLKQKTHRYYQVVNSWIRQNRVANNIYMRWEHSVGVIVMNPEEILKHFETGFRQGGRLLRRRIRRVDWVPRERLNEIGQARFDHDARVVDAVDRALRQGAKQIAIELAPVKSLPKPILPSPDLPDKK